jgi:hypothetical protein
MKAGTHDENTYQFPLDVECRTDPDLMFKVDPANVALYRQGKPVPFSVWLEKWPSLRNEIDGLYEVYYNPNYEEPKEEIHYDKRGRPRKGKAA